MILIPCVGDKAFDRSLLGSHRVLSYEHATVTLENLVHSAYPGWGCLGVRVNLLVCMRIIQYLLVLISSSPCRVMIVLLISFSSRSSSPDYRTINDFEFDISLTGFAIAMISVVTSSLQQISVRKMQSQKQKSAMDLIAFIGPYSGMLLLTLSPLMDYNVSHQWITEFEWNPWVVGGVLISAALAILVNISQYLCLGKFSAVEFQVMGHLKTVTVFIMCWLVLHESFGAIKWIGCLITIVGIYLFSRPPPQWIGSSK